MLKQVNNAVPTLFKFNSAKIKDVKSKLQLNFLKTVPSHLN